MAAPQLTPPPPTGISLLDRWLALLWRKLTATGEILWTQVSKAGSNLTDIETRNHADLQNINTADYTHLTATNATDLTDGGDSALHFHSSDRVRANHTGTQVAATISDFDEAAQDAVGGILVDSASIDFTYADATPSITAAVVGRHLLHGIGHNADGTYTSTLTYNETTRTVTIAPTGASFEVYIDGVRYTKTSESIAHSATGASQFVYYDTTGTLVTSTTPWDTLIHAPVAFIFQDVTNSRRVCFEERHHAERDRYWHHNQHFAEGTKAIGSGFGISGYVLNDAATASMQYSIASGTLADEDIEVDTEVLPSAGPYVIMARLGVGGDWQITRTSTVPFFLTGVQLQYNLDTAGTWSLANAGNGNFMNYFVFGATALPQASVTPSPGAVQQYVIIPGQAIFATEAQSHAETFANISWGTVPFQEIVPLYQVTMGQFSASGGTQRISRIIRVVGTAASITAATATDHGALSGLTDDDHSQYLLASDATSRAEFAANWQNLQADVWAFSAAQG